MIDLPRSGTDEERGCNWSRKTEKHRSLRVKYEGEQSGHSSSLALHLEREAE